MQCDVCSHDKFTHEWGEGRCRDCNCKKFVGTGKVKKEIKPLFNGALETTNEEEMNSNHNYEKIKVFLELIFDLDWETELPVIRKIMEKIKAELTEKDN